MIPYQEKHCDMNASSLQPSLGREHKTLKLTFARFQLKEFMDFSSNNFSSLGVGARAVIPGQDFHTIRCLREK